MQRLSKKVWFILGLLGIFGGNGALSTEGRSPDEKSLDGNHTPQTFTYEDELRRIPLNVYFADLKIKRPEDRVLLPKNVKLIADVWGLVMQNASLQDLITASRVCKAWHEAIHSVLFHMVINVYVGGSANPFPSHYPSTIGYRFWNERPQDKFASAVDLPTVHPLFNPHFKESVAAEAENKTDYRVTRWAPSPSFETMRDHFTTFFISQAFMQSRVLSYLLSLDYLGGNPLFLRNPNLNYLTLDHTALMWPLQALGVDVNVSITTLTFVSYRKLGNTTPAEMLANLLTWVRVMPLLNTLDISCLVLPSHYREQITAAVPGLTYFRRPAKVVEGL